MAGRIEDYALIGDTQSAALVGRDGSIDWMCLPRFDSDACFAALLGDERHGRWKIAPAQGIRSIERRYRPGTLILETTFHTDDGIVRVIDCMPPRRCDPDIVRIIEGVEGRVPMRLDLSIRFGYGAVLPWLRSNEDGITALAGPDALTLYADAQIRVDGPDLRAELSVGPGDRATFLLVWHPSSEPSPAPLDLHEVLEDTESFWCSWSSQCTYKGEHHDAVLRSLITLKALTYNPTGGIVAAPTTSLPERLGGVRNWDYRYCWVRDATFTLLALIEAGFHDEAKEWVNWLLRAVAGHPAQLHIMYGPAGERRLPEIELPWLPGYEGSKPVRIGNAAIEQFQLDVFGEIMDCIHQARLVGI
ncbi:MAG TPA: glycoside hydrolase family 15 protein, partial [Candidatus Nanopelagicales bacterium]|nr:glycoside hydrolase family 15 protein [Candidatus Nanopelagicales bacterium]